MRNQVIKKILLYVAWNLAIIILVLEIVLRFYITRPFFYNINLVGTNRLGTYMLSPNKDLIYEPIPNSGQYNAYGYRGKFYPLERTSKKRIIVLGDSVTDGLNVGLEDRFTELLSRHFKDRYEIINLAVCGYNFLQEFEYLKKKGIPYKPDYVIFMVTCNDFTVDSGQIDKLNQMLNNMKNRGFYFHYYNDKNYFERMLLHSSLYKCLLYVILSNENNFALHSKNGKVGETLGYTRVKSIIDKIKALGVKYRFTPYFMFLPTRTPCVDFQGMKDIFIKENANTFDIDEVIRKEYSTDFINDLFYDLEHLNKKGNKIVADILGQQFSLLR